MNRIPLCLAMLFTLGCASYPGTRDATNAVLWVQTSVEYDAAVRQSFLLALLRLDEALTQRPESPAVIMDLDETILDNSAFEARLIAEDRPFDMEGWRAWLAGTEAIAMPGAVEFVDQVRSRGVEVFFVTNRHERYRTATLETLRNLGFVETDGSGERLLMREQRPEWTADKETRRAEVARTRRVVLLVGNDLNDFVSCRDLAPEQRRELVQDQLSRFGRDWIMIPSPNWGSWLEALHGHRSDLSDEEMRARHLEWLRLGRE